MFYTVHRQRESISGTASSSLHLLTFILAFVGLAANPGATLAATSSANEVVIQVKAGSANSDHAAIQVDLPGSFSATTIRAVLNGKDISARLIPSVCAQDPCVTGTVSESDGLRVGKNVVYVTARTSEGKLATGRMRFFQGEAQRAASDGTKTVTNSLRAQATDASGSSSYLTPMETFQTVYAGGWDSNRPWFQVGLGGYYPASGEPACAAGSIYLALVFDRQALTPVGSKGCYSSGSTLAAFLKTLSSGDLVVVGTVSNASSDAELDTSAIGGTDHAKDKNIPTGYVAIGVGGATPGTAYENFAVQTNGDDTLATPMWPFATGVVQ